MKDTLKPIFVLTGICLIVAVLLAATNGITAPIIAANAEATAQQTRLELLPEADNFEVVPVDSSSTAWRSWSYCPKIPLIHCWAPSFMASTWAWASSTVA